MSKFNVVSSDKGTTKAITNPSIAIREYRTFRKGVFGWVEDAFVKQLDKETKDEILSRSFFNDINALTGEPLKSGTIIKDYVDLVLIGINRYDNVRFSEQYAPNDYYEILGFNIDEETDEMGLRNVMSFILPIGKYEDPIKDLINTLLADAFRHYYSQTKDTDHFDESEDIVTAMIRPVRFKIDRRKTGYGVIGYVKPSLLEPAQPELQSLAYEWLMANGAKVPVNPRYAGRKEEKEEEEKMPYYAAALDADDAPF